MRTLTGLFLIKYTNKKNIFGYNNEQTQITFVGVGE